jgi:cysteinyl-tRNA synthetase
MNPQPLTLYNTLSQKLEPFTPLEPGKVRMYVCGPTVYDEAHLGHARCYITWDVVFRFLQSQGYDVTYVRNVTDVDDKILKRAEELGETPQSVAQRNYLRFQEDMAALNVLPPTHEPRATAYIQEMIDGIGALIEKGAAYATPDGTVYYRTAFKKEYGELSKKPLDDLQAGARVEVDPHKESPTDFALWKGVSPDETTAWQTPWGLGRPGWHMECSAMSRSLLGDQLDIHAGGADLIFPHHENEIAQSEAWTGRRPFVRYWLHNGFVNVSGEKMSKSLGNFSTIKTLLDRYDANTIRYFLLTHHYRMPVDFNDEALQSAENRVIKLHRAFKQHLQAAALTETAATTLAHQPLDVTAPESVSALEAAFTQAMQEDINTPQALAAFNETVGLLNSAAADPSQQATREVALALALRLFTQLGFSLKPVFQNQDLPTEPIQSLYQELAASSVEGQSPEATLEALIQLRKTAKAEKNWPLADAIRNRLTEIGIALKDNKDGTTTWELTTTHDPRQPVA